MKICKDGWREGKQDSEETRSSDVPIISVPLCVRRIKLPVERSSNKSSPDIRVVFASVWIWGRKQQKISQWNANCAPAPNPRKLSTAPQTLIIQLYSLNKLAMCTQSSINLSLLISTLTFALFRKFLMTQWWLAVSVEVMRRKILILILHCTSYYYHAL